MNLEYIDKMESCSAAEFGPLLTGVRDDVQELLTFVAKRFTVVDIDLPIMLPANWNKAFHCQWINKKKMWTCTVSLTSKPGDLASLKNSVSARAPTYTQAVVVASLRAIIKYKMECEQSEEANSESV